MKMTSLLAGVSASAILFAMPAHAVQAPTTAEEAESEELVTAPPVDATAAAEAEAVEEAADAAGSSDNIVITGSRIRQPNLTSTVPITTVQVQELTDTGRVSLGDALNELPAMRSTFSQANSTAFIGTSGVNYLDLRGLGTLRTLVVVNGRRHVTTQPGIPQRVDINTIPVDLLERVDIITGGSSAVYGSDAIAGVVNFVTKRDYDGISVRGQGGISDEGDRGTRTFAITAGKNFHDGRGNIAGSFEYAKSDDLYYTDRDDLYGAYSGRLQFQQTDIVLGEPAAGDGIPDFVFRTGIRNMGISDGGAYGSTCPALTANPSAALLARRAANCTGQLSETGAELGYVYVFDGNGNLVRNIPDIDYRTVGSGNGQGGLGSSLRLTGQLIPTLERKSFNLLAHYDVTDFFKPFLEAKAVFIDANQEGQPTSIANLSGTVRLDNPFLNQQARTLLQTSLAPGATNFSIQRFNVDFGGRGEKHTRETYRVVTGIEGDFFDDWHYEAAFNYGHFTTHMDALGRIHRQRFLNAFDAAAGPNGPACRINVDADTTNNDASCVPLNVFGFGAPSQAALNYIYHLVERDQEASQVVLSANVSGDLSGLFELPGGPIAFALGGEYRRESAYAIYDPVTTSGATEFNIIPEFDPPTLRVNEAFGEVRVPLLANLPFAHELTFSAAGRISNYNLGNTGTVNSWNLSGVWAPIRDLRARVGYAKSVRAPTQNEMFNPFTQTFGNNFIDPCSQANINNGPNRVANCAAAGVPTTEIVNGATVPWTNNPSGGIRGLNGANPNLEAEIGKSLTVGFVAQPRWVPGLAIAVDYYKINVTNAINALVFQTVADLCYDDSTGIDNQYCSNIFRRPDGTFFGQASRIVGGTTLNYPLTTTESGFIQGGFNYAKSRTRGFDFDVSYRRDLFNGIKFNTRGILSYLMDRDNYTNVLDPEFRDQQKFELGDPEFAGTLSTTLDFGQLDVTHNMRYVGKQVVDFYETFFPVGSAAPTNADRNDPIWFPEIYYHNLRFGFEPKGTKFRFYAGVDNITDKAPPLGLDGTGGTGITGGSGAIYDNIGRFLYAGFEFKL